MASRLQDVILRGLAAAKPAATTVAPGTLYFSTDSGVTERCADTGLTWETYSGAGGGGGGPHAPTHAAGGSDPVTLAQSQITGLTTALAGKAPSVHATQHSAGGTDPVAVTNLAGYPGGTANFLRADGAFAAPPVGAGITQLTGDVTAGPGSGSQVATLANTAVTPGPYTNANVTVDAKGRIIAASNGSASVPAHHTTHEPGGSDPMAVDAAAATGSLRTLGTGSSQAAAGNDSRLTNARTPTAHATTHSNAGSDPVDVKNLGGYPGGTTNFLRADGTFAAPPAGGGILRVLCFTIDGAGIALTLGIKGIVPCPFAGTIVGWTLTVDTTSGGIAIDVCKAASSPPPANPSVPNTTTDKISASANINSSATLTKSSGAAGVSTWTTAVAQWDSILFNVITSTSVTRAMIQLLIQT